MWNCGAWSVAFLRLAAVCVLGGLFPVESVGRETPSVAGETAVYMCDRAAAAPWDTDAVDVPSRVAFRDVNAAFAIPACRRAIDMNPGLRRLSFQLGRAYDRQGANQDAYHAYKRAADLGSAAAKVNIGILYHQGRRFEKSDVKARMWFQEAAEMGLAEGMFCYATALDNGIGGRPDGAAARGWYLKAAQLGTAKARDTLVRLDIDGPGTGARCD